MEGGAGQGAGGPGGGRGRAEKAGKKKGGWEMNAENGWFQTFGLQGGGLGGGYLS